MRFTFPDVTPEPYFTNTVNKDADESLKIDYSDDSCHVVDYDDLYAGGGGPSTISSSEGGCPLAESETLMEEPELESMQQQGVAKQETLSSVETEMSEDSSGRLYETKVCIEREDTNESDEELAESKSMETVVDVQK